MPEFIATVAIFLLAALGLALGMLCGRKGLQGGCHGGGEGPSGDGCGRPGCCSTVTDEEEPPADASSNRPLVQLHAGPPEK